MPQYDLSTVIKAMRSYVNLNTGVLLTYLAERPGLDLAEHMAPGLSLHEAVLASALEFLLDEPPLTLSVTSVKRGETKNSSSPMWIMEYAGGRFYVFAHEDPEKNTFPVFLTAGYGGILNDMALNQTLTFSERPIRVDCVTDGKYLRPVKVHPRGDMRPDGEDEDTRRKREVAEEAQRWIQDEYYIVDFETTDKDPTVAQAVSLSIRDYDNNIIFDEHIRPMRDISTEALKIHGINELDAAAAKYIDQHIVDGMPLLEWFKKHELDIRAWNAPFDISVLVNSFAARGITIERPIWLCAMRLYAKAYGKWDAQKDDYRFISLVDAAKAQNVLLIPHIARNDTLVANQVIWALSSIDDTKDPF